MVILLDKNKKPLGWCHPSHVRRMQKQNRCVFYRYFPQVVIVKDRDVRNMDLKHDYRVKIDPGAKYTGITVVDGDKVVLFVQMEKFFFVDF